MYNVYAISLPFLFTVSIQYISSPKFVSNGASIICRNTYYQMTSTEWHTSEIIWVSLSGQSIIDLFKLYRLRIIMLSFWNCTDSRNLHTNSNTTDTLVCFVAAAHQGRVTAVLFSLTQEWVLSVGRDKYFQWHCSETGRRLGGYQATAWCTCLQYPCTVLYYIPFYMLKLKVKVSGLKCALYSMTQLIKADLSDLSAVLHPCHIPPPTCLQCSCALLLPQSPHKAQLQEWGRHQWSAG